MPTTPGARFVVDWPRGGLVGRASRVEINQPNTHVEAHYQASQDAGSIPAASTPVHWIAPRGHSVTQDDITPHSSGVCCFFGCLLFALLGATRRHRRTARAIRSAPNALLIRKVLQRRRLSLHPDVRVWGAAQRDFTPWGRGPQLGVGKGTGPINSTSTRFWPTLMDLSPLSPPRAFFFSRARRGTA